MKEPPLRTSCGGGSFVLRSAPERKAALGPALPRAAVTGNIDLNKDGARPFRPRFCFASRHVGVVATCIFASILQSKAPAYRRSGKNPCLSMLFANNRRCYGLLGLGLQGYSLSNASAAEPKALGCAEYPQNARRLEGDLRDKGNRPVEVCIRRGGLCIYPIKDTLRIC